MESQIGIKIVLLSVVAVAGVLVLWPGAGARRTALRRIGLFLLVVLAAAAIAFPGLTQTVADFLGVGRGTDLLLYGFIVAFVGSTVANRMERNSTNRRLTALARDQAIRAARNPGQDA
jgi:hypothetical protein